MRQLSLIAAILIFFVGCNVSENKEARIQKLESHAQQTDTKIQELETRIQTLESDSSSNER